MFVAALPFVIHGGFLARQVGAIEHDAGHSKNRKPHHTYALVQLNFLRKSKHWDYGGLLVCDGLAQRRLDACVCTRLRTRLTRRIPNRGEAAH